MLARQPLAALQACMAQSQTMFRVLRQAYSAVPVLYASQWLLTCFACPFSAPVACRVIDALLIENRPHCLLRVALALLAELEADLLALDDFEELITFIKARLFWHAMALWLQNSKRLNFVQSACMAASFLEAASSALLCICSFLLQTLFAAPDC